MNKVGSHYAIHCSGPEGPLVMIRYEHMHLGGEYVPEPYHTRTAMYCGSIRTYIGCEVLYAGSWSECTCGHVVK